MANEIKNKENEIDDDNINIDDIEGLERDLPENEMPKQTPNDNEEIEPLEILPDGKLKTSKETEDTATNNESEKQSLKQRVKESKSIKILLIVLGLLIISIILFVYLSGSNEVEEKPVEQTVKANELPPIETYEFKLDHINVSRLNQKLENLTKYELLGMTEEEYLKEEKLKALRKAQEEEELQLRLEKEAIEKAKKEELAQQEKIRLEQEALLQKDSDAKKEETANQETVTQKDSNVQEASKDDLKEEATAMSDTTKESENANSFLQFIQINTDKKAIYKSYLKTLKEVDTRINACRNINNYIEVFVGPLNKDEDSASLIDAIKNTNLSSSVIFIELTKEEFAKRCMISPQ